MENDTKLTAQINVRAQPETARLLARLKRETLLSKAEIVRLALEAWATSWDYDTMKAERRAARQAAGKEAGDGPRDL